MILRVFFMAGQVFGWLVLSIALVKDDLVMAITGATMIATSMYHLHMLAVTEEKRLVHDEHR